MSLMLPFDTIKKNLINYKHSKDDDKYKYQIIHLYFLLAKKKYQDNNEVMDFIINLFDENLITKLEKDNLMQKYIEPNKI